jgi:hypothetical protein
MAIDSKALKGLGKWIEPYRVINGAKFRLKHFSPRYARHQGRAQARGASGWPKACGRAEEQVKFTRRIAAAAAGVPGDDAAGKDSTTHVMSGVNPQVSGHCLLAAVELELDHDWMWRAWRALPERGHIGIFNRSYYEEVLVVRVHESLLATQKLPKPLVTKKIFQERLRDIANFEDYLTRNGTTVLSSSCMSPQRAEEAVHQASTSRRNTGVLARRCQGARH